MTPEALATLHARCFRDGLRPWSASEIETIASDPGGFLVADPGGFALGRAAGGEAELLTIAVAPEARRRGIARRLMATFEAAAAMRGAAVAFLEVAETNAAALSLYRGLGYAVVGRRPGYYRGGHRDGEPAPVAALVLRKAILHEDADAWANRKTD